MAQQNNFIVVNNVSHSYVAGRPVLSDINLNLGLGLFGLLGANGAGKSTLMRILCTLQAPSAGDVFVGGYNAVTEREQVRTLIGYLPQEFGAWRMLSVYEVLSTLMSLSGVGTKLAQRSRIQDVLERVGLSSVSQRKVASLSGGMLRRLGVAQALVHDPKVVIMDEPTTGLDPEERLRFRQLMADLSLDRCILLSTHIIADLGSSCSKLLLINNGHLEFSDSPANLIAAASDIIREFTYESASASMDVPPGNFEIVTSYNKGNQVILRGLMRDGSDLPGSVAAQNISLEEAYLAFCSAKYRNH